MFQVRIYCTFQNGYTPTSIHKIKKTRCKPEKRGPYKLLRASGKHSIRSNCTCSSCRAATCTLQAASRNRQARVSHGNIKGLHAAHPSPESQSKYASFSFSYHRSKFVRYSSDIPSSFLIRPSYQGSQRGGVQPLNWESWRESRSGAQQQGFERVH